MPRICRWRLHFSSVRPVVVAYRPRVSLGLRLGWNMTRSPLECSAPQSPLDLPLGPQATGCAGPGQRWPRIPGSRQGNASCAPPASLQSAKHSVRCADQCPGLRVPVSPTLSSGREPCWGVGTFLEKQRLHYTTTSESLQV